MKKRRLLRDRLKEDLRDPEFRELLEATRRRRNPLGPLNLFRMRNRLLDGVNLFWNPEDYLRFERAWKAFVKALRRPS